MRRPFRIDPALPATAYKTYQVSQPVSTHFRDATCQEVNCGAYERGWKTQIDESTELGQKQAYYIRKQSGRRFVEEHNVEGMTDFVFAPGQKCFQPHKKSLERPANYVVRDGDWRGNPLGTKPRVHSRPEHWVEDFAEHQDKIANEIQKG